MYSDTSLAASLLYVISLTQNASLSKVWSPLEVRRLHLDLIVHYNIFNGMAAITVLITFTN